VTGGYRPYWRPYPSRDIRAMTTTEPTARSTPDWAEIRRLYETRRDLAVETICERMGVKAWALRERASRERWLRRYEPRRRRAPDAGPTVLDRLNKAIELKLKQLEKSMTDDGPKSPADSERETRTIGTLIRNTEKVRELKKNELARAGSEPRLRSHRLTPEETERVCRELAERIRQFAAGQEE
jgi:hypothetical protein